MTPEPQPASGSAQVAILGSSQAANPPAEPTPSRNWSKWTLSAGVVLALIVVAAAFYMRKHQAVQLTDKDQIILSDFTNQKLGTARAQAQFDKPAAIKTYQQLLDIWKNADADFIPAQEAKREFASLPANR